MNHFVVWLKRNRWVLLIGGITALVLGLSSVRAMAATPPDSVTFFDNPDLQISNGVAVPRDTSYFFTSGLTPRPLSDGTYEPSTFDQSVDVLSRIEALLAEEALSMSDVIAMNVYLTADPETGEVDYQSWFDAYGQFFDNEENPVKTARTVVAVADLIDPDWRVEASAIAVYPR
ncbi:MAG: Rid family hydrolase [Cyanobacteria bacterium J06635_15]